MILDARRIAGLPADSDYIPSDPREFASRIFHTSYMGTVNSGTETRRRAAQLSEALGRSVRYDLHKQAVDLPSLSYHIDLNMDTVVTALMNLFALVTKKPSEEPRPPRFRAHGVLIRKT